MPTPYINLKPVGQEAMFALTMRKSGNDAARHVEILASGSVPSAESGDRGFRGLYCVLLWIPLVQQAGPSVRTVEYYV